MKNQRISIPSKSYSDLTNNQFKISCLKCGGSGNLKTPENSRRTCLSCFGRGYIIS
tara:strand:+ start:357 stop:524 length:168 start_codon:yes stop_codon:yes gene_type:complete